MTGASEVKVVSTERPELAVSPGLHKPPGSGLIHPVPPSLPIPPTSTLLPELHVHWLPSRHHISLHYAQCPENPPMKREDTSVYVSPAPLATPAFCLHCACTPGVSRLGVTNISGPAVLPSVSPQTEMQPEALLPPSGCIAVGSFPNLWCLRSTIILRHGFDLSLVPHPQSVLTPAQASHLLSLHSNQKQLLCR